MNLWELQVIKYLSSVERKDRIVQNIQQEKDTLKSKTYAIGNPDTIDRVQSSPSRDRIEKNVIHLQEKIAELTAAEDAYWDFRLQVMDQINRIESNKHAEILNRRYMQYQKFKNIAEEMNYSYSYVIRLHQEALNKFRRANPELIEFLKKI